MDDGRTFCCSAVTAQRTAGFGACRRVPPDPVEFEQRTHNLIQMGVVRNGDFVAGVV